MIMKNELHVKRGDIYYADLNPVKGSEQGGTRPVVIIQNDCGNIHSPTIIAAATTGRLYKPALPTHILIQKSNGNELKMDTVVLLEQIRTIDRSRLGSYIGHLSHTEMQEMNTALAVSVGLSEINK